MLDDNNKTIYTTRSIVQYYSYLKMLQPAEQTIIDLFQNQWSGWRILDIGVGGGRTTQHFAQWVREYVGIDYSTMMIAACQERFAATFPSATFAVCDAREMSQFEDNSFDFILFSFNGIDFVSHADRLKILQEVHRVGKPGSYFFFSSHNLQGIEQEWNWRNHISFNPIKTYINLAMWAILRGFNSSLSLKQLQTSTHAILRDESHNFRLKTYYVRPQEQIHQLAADFSNIQVYSWKSGLEITTDQELTSNVEMWLYYLCQIKP